MKTVLFKKPVLKNKKISYSLDQYILNNSHISVVLKNLDNQSELLDLNNYLISLLKFLSLSNKDNKPDFFEKNIRPYHYLLLITQFLIHNKFSFKKGFIFFDKLKTISYKHNSHSIYNFTTENADFVKFSDLLPYDQFKIHEFENKNGITAYSIYFLDLTFFVKDNRILFFKKGIILNSKNIFSYKTKYFKKDYY